LPGNASMSPGLRIRYRILRRPVKRAKIELRGGEFWVIVPRGADPYKAIEENRKWVLERARLGEEVERLAPGLEVVHRTRRGFKRLVREIVSEYVELLGVRVNRVFVRRMCSCWGSCSRAGNISISSEAIYLPERLLRYIIYHEVCHLIHWRHDGGFVEMISRLFPDHEELDLQLQAYWMRLKGSADARDADPSS